MYRKVTDQKILKVLMDYHLSNMEPSKTHYQEIRRTFYATILGTSTVVTLVSLPSNNEC